MPNSLFLGIILTSFLGLSKASVSWGEVELGKSYTINFGEGNFMISRNTDAYNGTQYYFASPDQNGIWTTDGEDRIPSTARLYFNGTLVFERISATDLGGYNLPLYKNEPISGDDCQVRQLGPPSFILNEINKANPKNV